jgi:hypothetical protein
MVGCDWISEKSNFITVEKTLRAARGAVATAVRHLAYRPDRLTPQEAALGNICELHHARYHDSLPCFWKGCPDRADDRSNQVRFSIGYHDSNALPCLFKNPQLGAERRLG